MSRLSKRIKRKPLMPVRASMCSTCPFRPNVGAKYAAVRDVLAESALTEASRICHQTGSNNAFHRRTGKQEALCRGARNLQLQAFAAMDFISAPTDEAWNAKCREMAMPEIPIIKQPIPNKPKAKRTKMSRPKLPVKSLRKSIGITLSRKAMKLGLDYARKQGVSFSELVNTQLLKLKP